MGGQSADLLTLSRTSRLRTLLVPPKSDISDLDMPPDILARHSDNDGVLSSARSALSADTTLRFDAVEALPWLDSGQPAFAPLWLLRHVGLQNLIAERGKERKASVLESSEQLMRDLRHLDSMPTREPIKIAVVYVGPNQFDEDAIFSNSKGSDAYQKFVGTLGEEVNMSTHTGFRGGLDQKRGYVTYYSSPTVEVIYHDSTRLPSGPQELRHLAKKKHIGNDRVHIIWNESGKTYQPGTISGKFGNMLIVIVPLGDRLFRVELRADSDVRTRCTPLKSDCVNCGHFADCHRGPNYHEYHHV